MKSYYKLHRQIKCSQCPDYKTGDARNCDGSDREIEYYCTWISEEGLLEKNIGEELKKKMTNKEIASRLAERCVGTNTNRLHFAMQLFVEEVVLDNDIDSYDEKDMEQYILEYLNMKGR